MLTKFLGISSLNPETQKLSKYFVLLYSLTQASLVFADGYLILFILDEVGYKEAALLFGIQLFIQGLIDFPTGVLADWIGHNWVMVMAYCSYGLAFLLLGIYSIIDPNSVFFYFLLVVLFRSFGTAQESGALQSWFDNNYKEYAKVEDPDKKIYGELVGKNFVLSPILPLIGIVLAAYITDLYGRETLFITQFFFIIPLTIVIFRLMGQFNSIRNNYKTTKYREVLKKGIMVVFKSKYIFYFSLSYLAIMIFINVWGIFFLFPIYFGYTGSDKLANFVRGTLFIGGIVMSLIASVKSKNLDPKLWIPRLFIITIFTWNLGYLIFLNFFPLPVFQENAKLNLTAIIFVILLGFTLHYISTVFLITFQKLMLEIIPDENRNSYYSLMPTIGVILSALLFPAIGDFINLRENMQEAFFAFLTIPLIVGGIFAYLSRWSETGLVIPTEKKLDQISTQS